VCFDYVHVPRRSRAVFGEVDAVRRQDLRHKEEEGHLHARGNGSRRAPVRACAGQRRRAPSVPGPTGVGAGEIGRVVFGLRAGSFGAPARAVLQPRPTVAAAFLGLGILAL
jgi:hypothetical protein